MPSPVDCPNQYLNLSYSAHAICTPPDPPYESYNSEEENFGTRRKFWFSSEENFFRKNTSENTNGGCQGYSTSLYMSTHKEVRLNSMKLNFQKCIIGLQPLDINKQVLISYPEKIIKQPPFQPLLCFPLLI